MASDSAERDRPGIPRFEADGGARGDVETHAVGFGAVEVELGVRLDEVVVGADLVVMVDDMFLVRIIDHGAPVSVCRHRWRHAVESCDGLD